jgi:L-asparaginase
MVEVAREVERAAEGSDAVIVTHGTSTLEMTAFVTDVLLETSVPVVFTGAMKRADERGADGPRNLRDSVMVACSEDSRGRGVLVVFGGSIFTARGAWKWHKTASKAFLGVDGRVGKVSGDRAVFYRKKEIGALAKRFSGSVETGVSLFKVYPGADGLAVRSCISGGTRGVVVEGFAGSGGVPEDVQKVLQEAVMGGLPVVLTSRAPAGRLPTAVTGGTGEPLQGIGLISGGGLSTEKALLLMMLALGDGMDSDGVRRVFEEWG